MMSDGGLWDGVRLVLTQEAALPALRTGLFLVALGASLSWAQRRPWLTVGLLGIFGLAGTGYWLIQMETPLGLWTDAGLSRQWAQVGVNTTTPTAAAGFVIGTPAEFSVASTLSLAGVPASVVRLLPQLAVLLCLAAQILLPLLLFRNRTTAVLGAGFAVAGGLWPGMSPYGAALQNPTGSAALILVLVLVLVLILVPSGLARRIRRGLHHIGPGLGLVLLVGAAMERALRGGADQGIAGAWLLIAACLLLAPALRAFVRTLSTSPSAARRTEGGLLLVVLTGSGLLWWDPVTSVPGFDATRDGNAALQRPMAWIRDHVPPGSVVLSAPEYSVSIAALAGRRVLFPPPADDESAGSLPEPFRRNRLWQSTLEGRPVARLAESFSATHLFLGPGEATPSFFGTEKIDDEPRLRLVLAYEDAEDFRVFVLAKK